MSQYATTAELAQLGINAASLAGISTGDQDKALSAASAEADSYLAARFSVPLTTWGDDLRAAVCKIAAWTLLSRRGLNPDDPAAAVYRSNAEDARAWLDRVARGIVTPNMAVTAPTAATAARVSTGTLRGW